MSYQKTLDYLFSSLPMYQNIGKNALKKNLTNIQQLTEKLKFPQNSFKSILIGGTNGKGSTATLTAKCLTDFGFKTGLYTSPHLVDFRERIQVNHQLIPKNYITHFVKTYISTLKKLSPSFFEWSFILALDYFRNQKVDFAIVEVGLGGRLDSTNILNPLISVITNVSKDHCNILGNTIQKIALEKAGIIKKNGTLILGEFQPESFKIFEKKALELNSKIIKAYETKNQSNFQTNSYQKQNIKTAFTTLLNIKQQLNLNLDENSISESIKNALKQNLIKGRWQTIRHHPKVIIDCAHNQAGFKFLKNQIIQEKYELLHIIIGIVKDKNLEDILPFLPKQANYYVTEPSVIRKLDYQELEKALEQYNLNIIDKNDDLKQLYHKTLEKSKINDLIIVTGSIFLIGDFLKIKTTN